MRALGGLPLVLGAAGERVAHPNSLDHEHLVLQVDLAFCFRRELPLARIDPARLQRATQGSRESTGGRRNDIVERGGVVGVLAWRGAVVLSHLVMGAKEDGLGLDWQKSPTDRASVAHDPDARDVLRLFAHLGLDSYRKSVRLGRCDRDDGAVDPDAAIGCRPGRGDDPGSGGVRRRDQDAVADAATGVSDNRAPQSRAAESDRD